MFQEYISIIWSTITNTRVFIIQSFSDKIWLDFVDTQRLLLAIFVYILFLVLLGKTHWFLQNKTNNALEKYTLAYDKILVSLQKKSYNLSNNQQNILDLDFIKTIIKSGSYLQNHQFLLDNIANNISDDVVDVSIIKELKKYLNQYKKINHLQKVVWYLVVIFSVGFYKIIW